MKTFIAAAVAASLIATPAFAAPNYNSGNRDHNRSEQTYRSTHAKQQVRHTAQKSDYRNANYRQSYNTRHWKKGERFDRRYASNYRVIERPRSYNLRNAPSGYRWVGSGNDAVLVGITTGIVAAVVANILR